MSSVKLTDHFRKTIKERIVGDRYTKQRKVFAVREDELAEKIYEKWYSVSDRKLMKTLPEGWLSRVWEIRAKFGNSDKTLKLLDRTLLVLARDSYYSDSSKSLGTFTGDDEIGRQYFAIQADRMSLEKDREKLEQQILGVLASVTTSARLIAVWPEIREVVENVCRVCDGLNLPAPQVGLLNKVLGLPPKVVAK